MGKEKALTLPIGIYELDSLGKRKEVKCNKVETDDPDEIFHDKYRGTPIRCVS